MSHDASGVLKSEILAVLLSDDLMQPLVLNAVQTRKSESLVEAPCAEIDCRVEKRPDRALRILSMNTRMWHSATFDGQEHEIVLRLMTNEAGTSNRLDLYMKRVLSLLHDADLPLAGHALVQLEFESSETRTDRPGVPAYCDMTFRALTVCD